MMTMNEPQQRLSAQNLEEIKRLLSPKSHEILRTIGQARFLTTTQTKRLFFAKNQTERASVRATNRCLNSLESLGLIETLPRTIGGYQGGSSVRIWRLSAAGSRLIGQTDSRRNKSPSLIFLEHTLAIAETVVRLKELDFSRKLKLEQAEFEPSSWRGFSRNQTPETLRPDLFAKLTLSSFEDSYFFEIDRATESLPRILAKCKQYVAYYNSGIEQRLNDVFPFVVWLVPTDKRAEAIFREIHEKLPRAESLFQVAKLDALETLITGQQN